MTTTNSGNQKEQRYINWLENRDALIKASRCLMRKKRSPFARLVAKGNIRAVVAAARNIVYSAMSKVQRIDFCRKLCDIKRNFKSLTKTELRRELIVLVASTLTGLAGMISGLSIALVWVLRAELTGVICRCGLTGKCETASCS